jgi:hypothetical protein
MHAVFAVHGVARCVGHLAVDDDTNLGIVELGKRCRRSDTMKRDNIRCMLARFAANTENVWREGQCPFHA